MPEPSTVITLAATALPETHRAGHCRACTNATGYLARYIHSNGTIAIRWVCDWCEDFKTAQDLPRTILPAGVTVDQLPLRASNYDPDRERLRCDVCEQPADEMHHWAPVAIFHDWPYELVVPLCFAHHREWHQRMRQHGLRWPHELEDAA